MTSRSRLHALLAFVLGTAFLTTVAVLIAPVDEADPPVVAADAFSATEAAVGASDGSSTFAAVTGPPATTTAPIGTPVPIPLAPGPLAPIISRVDTTDPVVFLTIDDGLVQDPAVLEWLRTHQVPVTMFPTPPFVAQNPEFFQAIHALGASVQDHTVNHKNLTNLSPGEQVREICDVPPIFEARFGQRPWMMRPPGGALNTSIQYATRSCGLRAIVLWRATMNDGRLDTQGGTLRAGDIVLLHFRDDLIHNLEVATAAARAQGLRVARLEDYLTPG